MKTYAGWIACALFLIPTESLHAGQWITFRALPEGSRVRIEGTSTMHDWTVESVVIHGHLKIEKNAAADRVLKGTPTSNPQAVKATLELEIPVRSLKSHKDGMDKKMYKALKEKKHPKIKYRLTDATIWGSEDLSSTPESTILIDARGELTVGGVTRPTLMTVRVEGLDNERLKISGETFLKMKDFKIKPPKAMLGIIRTGNKIKLSFEWMTELLAEKTEISGITP